MRYAIITNPAAGKMTVDQKRSALAEASKILEAKIDGLDTASANEFVQCARELVTRCDVLVAAGGDGTLSDIINAVDTTRTPVAYLPLGTGNAMQHALKCKKELTDVAAGIRNGEIHEYDLIDCDNKRRAFMASVGIEGSIIRLRDRYVARGAGGFHAYARAVFNSYFKGYRRVTANIAVDDRWFEVPNLLTLMVVKQPYYGFGMKVVPRARFDDRTLHILCVDSGLCRSILAGITAFTIGNRIGRYHSGRRVFVTLERSKVLQIDGDEGWRADAFTFTVLPRALKIKH